MNASVSPSDESGKNIKTLYEFLSVHVIFKKEMMNYVVAI